MTVPEQKKSCLSQYKNSPIRIDGGKPLMGRVKLQGSKNAALPIMAACILISGKCVLHNCPDITDVYYMQKLLECIGCKVVRQKHTISVEADKINTCHFPGYLVKKMRSSVILLGAMIGRIQEAGIDYPGGCVIGERPIDLHLMALERLGATIDIDGNFIRASVKELNGNVINFPFSSVGATQNAILAAVLAKGQTIINRASKEPEVVALCEFLNAAGADIIIEKNDTIRINGVERLHETEYHVMPDRIVAGTYLFAVMATGGKVTLENAPIGQMECVLNTVRKMGAEIKINSFAEKQKEIVITVLKRNKNIPYIQTKTYPGFPTDLQSPLMTAACVAEGQLIIRERIFANRFRIVEELQRMGADIRCVQDCAIVRGVKELEGRNVIARELRGGGALVIAGLCAKGITTVMDTEFIERGYEDIVRDLSALGARISNVE